MYSYAKILEGVTVDGVSISNAQCCANQPRLYGVLQSKNLASLELAAKIFLAVYRDLRPRVFPIKEVGGYWATTAHRDAEGVKVNLIDALLAH